MADRSTENERIAAAYEAGYEKALEGVWFADAVTPFEPPMFEDWLRQQQAIPPEGVRR